MTAPKPYLRDQTDYGPEFRQHLLYQYQLMAESADRVSSRRQAANGLLVTVNGSILGWAAALLTLAGRDGGGVSSEVQAAVVIAGVVGIGVCFLWVFFLRAYRELNHAKFTIINDMERHLPASMYDAEWEVLNRGRGRNPFAVTRSELLLPLAAGALHITLLVFGAVA